MPGGAGRAPDWPGARAIAGVGVPLPPGAACAAVGALGGARVVAAAAARRGHDEDFRADGHDGHRGVMHSLGRPPGINDRRHPLEYTLEDYAVGFSAKPEI